MIGFLVSELDVVLQILLSWMALGLLLFVVARRGRRAIVQARRRLRQLGERGGITTEFVVTITWFVLLFTAILQIAMVSMAILTVRYAAFCAARAAIVLDPDETVTDRAERIRKAAVYPLIAVSPTWSVFMNNRDNSDSKTAVTYALDDGEGGDGEQGALYRIKDKRQYAEISTEVSLAGDTSYTGSGPVTATVYYRFICDIPFAQRVMCGNSDYGPMMIMFASHTLINQGAPVPLPDPDTTGEGDL